MTQRKTNPFGKKTTKDKPYAIYRGNRGFTWCILKTYKRPDKEAEDKRARWFTFTTSDYCPEGEFGDAYAGDIKQFGRLSTATDEWREHYPND